MSIESLKKFKYLVKAFTLLDFSNDISEDEILDELGVFIHKIPLNRKIQTCGSTLLNRAIYYDHFKIVKSLLDNGADVSLKDDNQHYKPIIYYLNKFNIPLTMLLLSKSKTKQEDLLEIIKHSIKYKYKYMIMIPYAICALYLLLDKDISYILNIKKHIKINPEPGIYTTIINYPALCLHFNPSFYKYYPKNTRDKLQFIIWSFKHTEIVIPLEMVFLILQKMNLIML